MTPEVQVIGLLTQESPLMMTGRRHPPRCVRRRYVRNPATPGPPVALP